jgi:hypothetical protein
VVDKRYVQIVTDQDRIRVRFKKDRGKIIDFVVQYETLVKDDWVPIIRYDTAHGQPHTDVISPDGTRKKRLLHFPNFNDAFSYAEEDIKTNWERYRQRYFRGAKK